MWRSGRPLPGAADSRPRHRSADGVDGAWVRFPCSEPPAVGRLVPVRRAVPAGAVRAVPSATAMPHRRCPGHRRVTSRWLPGERPRLRRRRERSHPERDGRRPGPAARATRRASRAIAVRVGQAWPRQGASRPESVEARANRARPSGLSIAMDRTSSARVDPDRGRPGTADVMSGPRAAGLAHAWRPRPLRKRRGRPRLTRAGRSRPTRPGAWLCARQALLRRRRLRISYSCTIA